MKNKTKERQIVYNSVKCLECGEVLVSYHRHDYKMCSCPNRATVDGGTDYIRYGAKDMDRVEVFTVYDDEDFEVVRKYATRGSLGPNGDQPVKWIPLREMEYDHLKKVVEYGGSNWHIDLIKREIEYRNEIHDTKKVPLRMA